ncbi:MAG: translation initiation factor IF-2 subunit alpha [Desulfurococcales archaeon]|nr:translation initiation factor IF-2 subunit alpha [Desulfurococcales archaeon]
MVKIKPRKPLPEVGELVVGTVKEIYDYGAYLDLDEYGGIRAFLPWSEIATRMVRNIRHVLKEGQKVVVKVIRVYKKRGQVDVSLKRVSEGERRRKMIWWKRTLKAAAIAEIVASNIGKPIEKAYDEVIWPLDNYYGDALTGLEQATIYGEQALRDAGIPEEWIKPLLEEARKRVEVKKVQVSGIITLQTLKSDGIDRIRSILEAAYKSATSVEPQHLTVRIYTVGAPRYRVDLISHDYRIIERALKKLIEEAERNARKLGVDFSFERLRS